MSKTAVALCALAGTAVLLPAAAFAAGNAFKPDFSVLPLEFDPDATFLVASLWKRGLGCPGQERFPLDPGAPFACIPGDPTDDKNEGLQLVKTGPTANRAFAAADLKGVKGMFLTELGYDLRKANAMDWPTGSQCGVRAPRFEITTADGKKHFMAASAKIGCQFPPAFDENPNKYWRRPRWGGAAQAIAPLVGCNSLPDCTVTTDLFCGNPPCEISKRVRSIRIVFDVGQDSLPNDLPGFEEYGMTVLDNIDVNGKLRGQGPTGAAQLQDHDEGQGRDKDGREFKHTTSASQPSASSLVFTDPVAGITVQSVGAAKTIAYNAGPLGQPCVSFTGDALVNGKAGYLFNFTACDLSSLGTGLDLGSYSITVNGPIGTLPYTQAADLVMGYVDIHK